MRVHVQIETGPLTEAKGVKLFKPQYFKTKTKMEIGWEGKERPDMVGDVARDVKLLAMGGEDVSLTVTCEGITSIGRIMNRSITALSKIALDVPEAGWEDDSGVWPIEGMEPIPNLNGNDLPYMLELLARLVERAMGKISGTHHPLTLFDLKQAAGLVYDAKQGDAGAESVLDWITVRELTTLEATKDARKEASAQKRAKEKVKRHQAKAEEGPKGKAKPKPKAKAKGGSPKANPKAKATASLSGLT